MDHRCKEVLSVGEYVRYMDDFLIFAPSPDELERAIAYVQDYSSQTLRLTLKPVVRLRVSQGVPFLGYTVFPHKTLLNARSKRRFRGKMAAYEALRASGQWSEREYHEHITPLLAFAQYAYTKRLRQRIINQTAMGKEALTA